MAISSKGINHPLTTGQRSLAGKTCLPRNHEVNAQGTRQSRKEQQMGGYYAERLTGNSASVSWISGQIYLARSETLFCDEESSSASFEDKDRLIRRGLPVSEPVPSAWPTSGRPLSDSRISGISCP